MLQFGLFTRSQPIRQFDVALEKLQAEGKIDRWFVAEGLEPWFGQSAVQQETPTLQDGRPRIA